MTERSWKSLKRTVPPSVEPRCGVQCEQLDAGQILVCDRDAGHLGAHRGYHVERDMPMFWRQRKKEE